MVEPATLTSRLITVLRREGHDWDALQRTSEQIIVFGSTAAGVDSAASDIDVLCVGNGVSSKSRRLDLLTKSPEEITSMRWRRCELAGHVASYGIWLKGNASWSPDVGEEAFLRKKQRIVRLVASASRHWRDLSPPFRARHLTTIRREVKRLSILSRGLSVPPTPILESSSCAVGLQAAQDAVSDDIARMNCPAKQAQSMMALLASSVSSHGQVGAASLPRSGHTPALKSPAIL
jgi:Nucleotidyltransferase domain